MVRSFMQLLEDRYGDKFDDSAKEYIGFAVDGAARMSALIKDLLEYSRVTHKGRKLQPTSAQQALDNAIVNLRNAIAEAGAEVTHDELPTVLGDKTQLTQVFQNLVGNAVKFRAADRPCKVHIGVRRQQNQWEFFVRDNGIGMDEAYRDRIFMIFQRLHNRQHYDGTGIGLAICKKIVERHGGRIWVESQPGEGSTFYFTAQPA
jgi:light-regulated signal transduction histidine kinase (bacteriophytochrome)